MAKWLRLLRSGTYNHVFISVIIHSSTQNLVGFAPNEGKPILRDSNELDNF